MDDKREETALFRYSLIREAADRSISPRIRGEMVRALSEKDHLGAGGERVRVSRVTLDRWIRAYRAGGFEALLPKKRKDDPHTAKHLLELAVKLKGEEPRRTAAQVRAVMLESTGDAPSERTLQRHFASLGLNRKGAHQPRRTFGRFQATAPGELWSGDALHAIAVEGRKSYLFAFIDDFSRLLTGYRFGLAEDSLRLEAALRLGLSSRGVPKSMYVDNGSPFVSRPLIRACAVLGIRLVHSAAGKPEGRGKIERVFRTVREQFLVEAEHRGVSSLEELNRLFRAWVEGVYHRRVHTETGEPPIERFLSAGAFATPTPDELREAFLWSEWRTVNKTATVSLYSNRYEVDQALAGRKVELVFDPFDLTEIEVRYQGRKMGIAVPHMIGRHVHPHARTEIDVAPSEKTGIDYLSLIERRRDSETKRRISYTAIPEDQEDKQKEEQDDVD